MHIPIHRLTVSALPLLRDHYARLSAEDLRLRFGMTPRKEHIDRYLEDIDFDRDCVFGAYADDQMLAGVAHLACLNDVAELGLSILPGFRRQGIGTALLDRAVTRARNAQIGKLFVHCLAENTAVIQLARKLGMQVVRDPPEADAYLELTPGTLFTIGREFWEQEVAIFDLALKSHLDSKNSASA